MKKRLFVFAMAPLAASTAWAHPGHPALNPTHTHVFGVDPLWLAVIGIAVGAGVWIARRRGARPSN